jgi:D-alanyl-D-alanine carboxypeptidase
MLRASSSILNRALLLVIAAALMLAGAVCAQSVIAVDLYNKKIHVASGATVKRPVGGLTKIATALVALDWSDVTSVGLNILATVTPRAIQLAGGSELELEPGDQLTLRDLIFASMMTGDGAAAAVLAEFIGNDVLMRLGRRGDPVAEFVSQMNKLAAREGCKSTRFTNPHGFENTSRAGYSTAADIARLTCYAVTRAPFKFYTSQKTRDVTVLRGGQRLRLALRNTNALLGSGTIDGVKTGNTAQSGGCIVLTEEHPGTAVKNSGGPETVYRHRMIVVLLASADPFSEGRTMLRTAWDIYHDWTRSGRPVTDRTQLLSNF